MVFTLPEGLPEPAYIRAAFERLRAREMAWLYSLSPPVVERLGGTDSLHHLTFSGLAAAVLMGLKPCFVVDRGK